jgi:hypothetical protein
MLPKTLNRKLALAGVLALPLLPAGLAVANSTPASAATTACQLSHHVGGYPVGPERIVAHDHGLKAGALWIAPAAGHQLSLTKTTTRHGWTVRVDQSSGDSVEANFSSTGHFVRVEVDVTDTGRIEMVRTAC